MIFIKTLRRLTFAAAAVLLPANAFALAIATVDASALNVRVGPGTRYEAITSVRGGTRVTVYGYTRDGSWCDISVERPGGLRGWVYCDYLDVEADVVGPVTTWGPAVGLPIIVYSYGDYHDHHYRDRPWYRDRDHWRPRRRAIRRDWNRIWDDGDRRRDRRREVRRRDRDRDSDVERMLRTKEQAEGKTNCRLASGQIICDD